MSFRVCPGEVVALVGPSGGGKSTCVSLLQNFYQPDSGHVLLDGVPVQHYDHHCLHAKVSRVLVITCVYCSVQCYVICIFMRGG